MICYSMQFAKTPSSVVPYLDMVNHGINSVVNKLHPSKIIEFVEQSLTVMQHDKFEEGILRSVRLFDKN